jgi:penicillin-binding protein 1A
MSAQKKKVSYWKYIKWIWLVSFTPLFILGFLIILVYFGAFGRLPSFEELENPRSVFASEVYTADQKLLGKYFIENRSNVKYEQLSPNLVNALISTEDERFFEHSGVDLEALVRVLFRTVISGDKGGGGGSTITQQLAKNLYQRDSIASKSKSGLAVSKVKEWITAVKLEKSYTKEEIIALYFNTVDFSSNAFGIRSAANTYFGTTPDSLNIQEAAMLVGMLKAPTSYNPKIHPDASLTRRNTVLYQMKRNKYITQAQFDSLKTLPIVLKYSVESQNSGMAPYFREYLRDDLEKWCKENKKPDGTTYNLYKDGLKIYTTVNSKMQSYAEQAVKEHLKKLQKDFFAHWKGFKNAPYDDLDDKQINVILRSAMLSSDRYRSMKRAGVNEKDIERAFKKPVKMKIFTWNGDSTVTMSPWDSIRYHKSFLQTGFMAMEPQTGYVRAWVGGINHYYFKYDHVKVSKRQVGSTFKPFVYGVAMQSGLSPCYMAPNVTISVPDGDKVWVPSNSSKYKEGQMMTLKDALAHSVNKVSAFLIMKFGVSKVIEFARKVGISSYLPHYPSLCLGTADLSVFEMVGANSTFANKGTWTEPIYITRIEDKYGNVLAEFKPKKNEAMSEETAFLILSLMKGVVEEGTGGRLRSIYKIPYPVAGKTGTTQNNSDGWFMGITPDLVSGVWVGCEDRAAHFRTTDLGQGASMALPIWALFMKKVYADPSIKISKGDFERPKGEMTIETDCGKYNQSGETSGQNFNSGDGGDGGVNYIVKPKSTEAPKK